jgi:tryptophanyl-tRNA synthetase
LKTGGENENSNSFRSYATFKFEMKRSLSGIKPTGTPHLGNYLGMIKPAIDMQDQYESYYFIANFHALTTVRDPKVLRADTLNVAAQFLAFGLDPNKAALYRQSDIPEVTELTWYLSCVVSLGDLFRAHAFKAAKDAGEEGMLNLGVFAYPVLMAADILICDSDVVPVGKDQVQHLEMARSIAQRFNFYFGNILKEPKELVRENVAVVPGTDGRKMSKSYNNGIEPLLTGNALKKQIMAIQTDSKGLEDKKDPDTCNVYNLYKLLATPTETASMAEKYRAGGYGYGHAKIALLEKIEDFFEPSRARYQDLLKRPKDLEDILQSGAQKARKVAVEVVGRCRQALGIV